MALGIGNGGYKLEGGNAGAGQVGTETNYIGETTTVSLDETKSAQAQKLILPTNMQNDKTFSDFS